jgi:NitT/TauT family transport system ATP-binding protein
MISIKDVSKIFTFGDNRSVTALERISFDFEPGRFYAIVGPSGCGKTTLLKIIAGILRPSTGNVSNASDGKYEKSLSMVFQDHDLFPWLTIEENIRLSIKSRLRDRCEQNTFIQTSLAKVGLADFGTFFPGELSGGMQKRASLARALCREPSLLLLDEPFNSVDHQTRDDLHELVMGIFKESPRTFIFVTHDIHEAVKLSQTVIVLSAHPGKIKAAVDIPYEYPRKVDDIETRTGHPALVRNIRRLLKDEMIRANYLEQEEQLSKQHV